MKLLEVIPIAKGITTETLSYFTGSDVALGSIVKVPLRKKIISAIVVSSKEAHEAKSEIKNSSFTLKKIEQIQSYDLLRKEFIEAAQQTGDYYVGSTGSTLNSLVPKAYLESAEKLILKINPKEKFEINQEKFAIQCNDEDRYAHYKSIIREDFAKGTSVFFCLPTIQDIKTAVLTLQKGIEPYTFILHGSMTKKEIITATNKILKEEHPVLIIATGMFLSIPKYKICTIILDRENSRSYKNQIRPYIDMRKFAEIYAEKIHAKIIFGDLLLRAETIHRYKKSELIEIAPLKFRSLSTSSETIVDMKTKIKDADGESKKSEFRIFSHELEEKINETIFNNEHMFMFAARRGLSPSTVCADCENIVKCNTCGAHTVLHKSNVENFFLCHKCGERRSAIEKCAVCGGWRLTTLGIGSELVEEKIQEMFPKANIFRIDSDATPSHKHAESVAESFYNSPQGILIGTEMALAYVTEKVENTAVVSMDSFFSIPDYRINERVMNILLKMRAITSKSFIVQTRDIKQKVFDYAMRGNLIDFFKDEIEDRKILRFPPFGTLIKISASDKKDILVQSMEALQKMIDPYEMDVFPAFLPQGQGKFALNGIIRIPEKKWPDNTLLHILKSLPMNFSVNIDPDSLI